jgi:hypothetical protein
LELALGVGENPDAPQLRGAARVVEGQRPLAWVPQVNFAGDVPVPMQHQVAAALDSAQELTAERQLRAVGKPQPLAPALEPRLLRKRERVVVQKQYPQRACRCASQCPLHLLEHGRRQFPV